MADVPTDFAKPIFKGGRFEDHTLPVQVLGEFEQFREILIQIARSLFLARHDARKNLPPGFKEVFQLKLRGVEADCAVPVLVRPPDTGDDVRNEWLGLFDEARDVLTATIDALSKGSPLPAEFPIQLLADLQQFGASLEDTESIEFRAPGATSGPSFNAALRRSIGSLRDEGTREASGQIKGEVVAFDSQKGTFRVRNLDGGFLQGDQRADIEKALLDALKDRKFRRVTVVGTIKYVTGAPKQFSSVTGVEIWEGCPEADVAQVAERLAEFEGLEKGWLDGAGQPLPKDGLNWLKLTLWRIMGDYRLPRPRLFPTPGGDVEAEWTAGDWEISATFNLAERTAALHAANVETLEDAEAEVDPDILSGERAMIAFFTKHGIKTNG